MESSNEDDKRSRKINTFKVLRVLILAVIAIAILTYAAISLFGSPEQKTIMAPGPLGHTNSIEKQVG